MTESIEVQTMYFRMESKDGRWVWLHSRGKVICKNSKKFSIVFTHCPVRLVKVFKKWKKNSCEEFSPWTDWMINKYKVLLNTNIRVSIQDNDTHKLYRIMAVKRVSAYRGVQFYWWKSTRMKPHINGKLEKKNGKPKSLLVEISHSW